MGFLLNLISFFWRQRESKRKSQRYTITGRRLVVGCIPYRLKEEEKQEDDGDKSCSGSCMDEMMEVLLISSQKGGAEIMFPKGGWEKDESREVAASREAYEEAGVLGNVQEILGKWSFKSKRYGTMYDGFMFPLHVTKELDDWPEMNVRRRRWVTVAEARESCQHWWMKEALEKFVNIYRTPKANCVYEGSKQQRNGDLSTTLLANHEVVMSLLT